MSIRDDEHKKNVEDEFNKDAENIQVEMGNAGESTQRTPEGKISSLGKVDPLKGRGMTSPDDPEIKRIQALAGYIELEIQNLPSAGRFYRNDFSLHIRPARVGEIRDFSTMDENNLKDIDDKLNHILMMCTKIQYGKSVGSFKDIMEEDRIYLLLSIRELTFKEGEASLMLKGKPHDCPTRGATDSIELRTTNLDFQEEDQLVAKYYDNENRCYSVQTKSHGVLKLAPPTIGVMRAVTSYIRSREEENKNWDKSSLQILPYIQREWRGWGSKDIFSAVTEFQGWDASKYSIVFRLVEKMKIGVKPELIYNCSGCGTEVLAPLEFPDGIKSLFVIPDISGELL